MFEDIVHKYRDELIRFCMAQMHRGQAAADDVVQDVFLALYKKRSVDLNDNIRAWLYEAARRKIKEYNRKNPIYDDISAICEQPDPAQQIQPDESPLDVLSDEERKLIESYYMGEDKNKIASANGTTVNALYCKIMRIRKKLSIAIGIYHKQI